MHTSHSSWCQAPVFTHTETIDDFVCSRAIRTVYRFGASPMASVSRYVEGRASEHYWVSAAYAERHCAAAKARLGAYAMVS